MGSLQMEKLDSSYKFRFDISFNRSNLVSLIFHSNLK